MSATHPHVDVKSLKVADLKEELTKRDLDTKGLKKELADRLQAFQDAEESSTAPTVPDEPKADEETDGDHIPVDPTPVPGPGPSMLHGAGGVMVQGSEEIADAVHSAERASPKLDEDMVDAQPAALDDELAHEIARAEMKERDGGVDTPSPPRALEPLSPPPSIQPKEDAEEVDTPPLPTAALPAHPEDAQTNAEDEDMQLDDDEEPAEKAESKKRPRSPSIPPADQNESHGEGSSKRPRLALPSSLSHLSHPPTSTLYITNLRRPLQHSALHDFLSLPESPSDQSAPLPPARPPFASPDYPGLWVSGVKDHAYATYPSVEEALSAAERVDGQTWPEDIGAKLSVEFVDDAQVHILVSREEDAWTNGRQKFTLKIHKPEHEGGEYLFELSGSGRVGPSAPPRGGEARDGRLPPPGVVVGRPPGPGGSGRLGHGGPVVLGPNGRPIVTPPLTGVNAITPQHPRGPISAPNPSNGGPQQLGLRIQGRGAQGLPPHPNPPSRDLGTPRNDGRRDDRPMNVRDEGRNKGPERERRDETRMRPTRFRPRLFWKKGPGAVSGAGAGTGSNGHAPLQSNARR